MNLKHSVATHQYTSYNYVESSCTWQWTKKLPSCYI